jgi:hypothetical protein
MLNKDYPELRENTYMIVVPEQCCFTCSHSEMNGYTCICHAIKSDETYYCDTEGWCALWFEGDV